MSDEAASVPRLQAGSTLYRRLVLFLALMSALSISLIALYLYSLLRLSAGEWRGFLQILAVLGPLLFVVSSLQNAPLYRPLVRCLDAEARGEATPGALRDAFRAACAMPYRLFLNGMLWWSCGGVMVAVLMAWRFQAFGAFRAVCVALGAASGGFVCSVFVYFGVKYLMSATCRELGRRIGDPAEREALVRRVPLARKLRWSVTGVTFTTVAFALFFSLVFVSEPIERNAVEIQSRFLAARVDAVRADPDALAQVRQEARDLGIASELVWVDLAQRRVRDGDPDALLADEIAVLGEEPGRSTAIDSPHAFAWQPVDAGAVLVAVEPWERLAPSSARAGVRFGMILGVSAAIALVLAQGLSRDLASTTALLGASAERVAAGDLRRAEVVESEDELGDVARAFERMAAALRSTVGRVSETADRVEATASETATVSESVAAAAESQSKGVAETAHSMQSLTGQVSDISTAAQELDLLVEDASSSMMELGASGEQLAQTANTLFGTVDEVSSSIQESARSMREVSTNAATLAEVADDTSASSAQMARNMREVSAGAEESAARSRQVVETAERGRKTVRQTVESMTGIREATDSAERVIRGLGARAGEIGSIVDVIGDVADETNLLALNAAIIAAQAGEHGRAFSVVAEEIKQLADRVLSSTREVAELIRAVQDESGRAVEAMAAGADRVAEGVRHADEAGASLDEITRVSRDSGEGMERILAAVQEQTRASAYVVEQMESVKRGVDAIQRATAEQDRGNETIVQSTEAMREIARQLQATTAEQARGSRRIRESIEGVRSATESINGALRLQGGSAREVGGFLEELASKGAGNEESAGRMQEVARQLLGQAAALRRDVERFRL